MDRSSIQDEGWPDEVVGGAVDVPVLSGALRYVNLDNAASTPPLVAVRETVHHFAEWYASVHRGSGYKSRLSTHAYESARAAIASFIDADSSRQVVVFVKNTTEGLNKIAHALAPADPIIFVSIMEHHANMLPWRFGARDARYVTADAWGVIDQDDLEQQLKSAPIDRPRLVAMSGAYNVTGYTPPVHEIARLAHRYGAEILVDGAQLVPHQPVSVRGSGPDDALDYLVFSGHKLYAPYGMGALIAPRAAFEGRPDLLGGGIVDLVTLEDVEWADLPDRAEAGSPNVIGAVALHAAVERLEQIGMPRLAAHERELAAYALTRLADVPGLRVLGPPTSAQRVGAISFTLAGVPPFLVAAILSFEWAVAVRSGCFCAHPGMMHLLDIQGMQREALLAKVRAHDKIDIPGATRASLGLYNSRADIDVLVAGLQAVATQAYRGSYVVDRLTGEYEPIGFPSQFDETFSVRKFAKVPSGGG